MLVTIHAAAALVAALAASSTSADRTIAAQFFPESLAADARKEELQGYVPRQFVATTTHGRWIFAAYSDGYSGVVRVIERTSPRPRLAAESTFPDMAGTAPGIQMLDLDANGSPEVLASFADQYGTDTFWIFAWNGGVLQLLNPVARDAASDTESSITDATFVDVDADGTLEVIDQKAIRHWDSDGEATDEALYTIYSLRDSRLSPSSSATLFRGFRRGTGKPMRDETTITVAEAGRYRLRVVSGDGTKGASSSANVWINDAAVLSPSDFKRSDKAITRGVNLAAGTHTLAVQMNGKPESHVWVLLEPWR